MDLCFIIPCKGRLGHLKETLPTVVAVPGTTCVVVDYSCPENCGDWVEANFPQVRVVRVADQPFFRLSDARNRGVASAGEPWLCFLDADVRVKPEFVGVLSMLRPGRFFRAAPPTTKELVGTVICLWKDFRRVGGYDEVFEGWGAEDLDFFARLRRLDLKEETFPADWLEPILHEDELRGRYFEIAEIPITWTVNALYAQIKLDLARILNRDVALTERQYLYSQVKDWILRVLRGKSKQAELKVAIRKHQMETGLVEGFLTYQFKGLEKPS